MPRRPSNARRVEDLINGAVDVGVDAFFDRAVGFVETFRERQVKALPSEYMSGQFKCFANTPAICAGIGPVSNFEVVHPANGFGVCKQCFAFMWSASAEKVKEVARSRAQDAAGRATGRPATPPMRKPWEVLGIDRDASVDEIKKAYKKLAIECHPDVVPPDAGPDVREANRRRFEEITRCKDAMLKVREAAK